MHARQRVDQMKTGRERFAAHVAEKIDNSDVSSGDHTRRAKQQEKENDAGD